MPLICTERLSGCAELHPPVCAGGTYVYLCDYPTEKMTPRTKTTVASSNIQCNTNGCKTGSKQHGILSQSVAPSSRAVSSQSTHCGTQVAAELLAAVVIRAISAAAEVASVARGRAQGVWQRSSTNNPSGPWEDTKVLTKAKTGDPRDRKAALFMLFQNS